MDQLTTIMIGCKYIFESHSLSAEHGVVGWSELTPMRVGASRSGAQRATVTCGVATVDVFRNWNNVQTGFGKAFYKLVELLMTVVYLMKSVAVS